MRHLRDFGFGKASMEDSLNEEVQKLIEVYKQDLSKPVDLSNTMNISIVNALWHIITGEKLDLQDPKLTKIIALFNDFFRTSEGPTSAAANVLPKFLLQFGYVRKLIKVDKLETVFSSIFSMIKPCIEDHKASLDEDNVRDLIDQFLTEIKNTTDPSSVFYG